MNTTSSNSSCPLVEYDVAIGFSGSATQESLLGTGAGVEVGGGGGAEDDVDDETCATKFLAGATSTLLEVEEGDAVEDGYGICCAMLFFTSAKFAAACDDTAMVGMIWADVFDAMSFGGGASGSFLPGLGAGSGP